MIVTVELEDVGKPELRKPNARRQALRAMAREWRAEGHVYQSICEACNVSIMTAWKWCHDVPRGKLG